MYIIEINNYTYYNLIKVLRIILLVNYKLHYFYEKQQLCWTA